MGNEKVSVNLESRKPVWCFYDKKLHIGSGGTFAVMLKTDRFKV